MRVCASTHGECVACVLGAALTPIPSPALTIGVRLLADSRPQPGLRVVLWWQRGRAEWGNGGGTSAACSHTWWCGKMMLHSCLFACVERLTQGVQYNHHHSKVTTLRVGWKDATAVVRLFAGLITCAGLLKCGVCATLNVLAWCVRVCIWARAACALQRVCCFAPAPALALFAPPGLLFSPRVSGNAETCVQSATPVTQLCAVHSCDAKPSLHWAECCTA